MSYIHRFTIAKRTSGFTIVELLIVIVVIAVLASISVVAFNGVQQRARDAQRRSDVRTIATAFEAYYIKNGAYPATSGSTAINSSWSTTADASWANLESQLVPEFIAKLPRDPVSTPKAAGNYPWDDPQAYDYSIFSSHVAGYCEASKPARQAYIFSYRLESGAQQNTLLGDCTSGTPISPYAGSNYRVVK